MPQEWLGAYVTLFASEVHHDAALQLMATDLLGQGYEIKGIEGKIDQLDPNEWDSFVADAWSDFPDFYPKQEEILAAIDANNLLIYSPYAGYDQAAPNK